MSKYSDRADGFEEGSAATTRPDYVSDDHLAFLDELRETGLTNMYGARPYLMDAFPELENKTAAAVLAYWMRSFGRNDR